MMQTLGVECWRHRFARWAVVLGLGVGTCAFVCGCDRADPGAEAAAEASTALRSTAWVTTTTVSDEEDIAARKARYQSLLNGLRDAAKLADPQQRGAIDLEIHTVQMGLADLGAHEMMRLEQNSLDQAAIIRSVLSEWVSHSAVALGREAYDPAPEFEDIDQKVRQKDDELAQAQERLREVQQRIGQLKEQSDAESARAAEHRASESELRQQVMGLSAVEGESLIRQAVEHKRQAEGYEVQAALLQAEIDKTTPVLSEVRATIDRLTRQKNLLGEAREQVRQRQVRAQEEAALARDAAEAAETELTELLGQLRTLRSGELAEKTTETIDAYREALETARRADRSLGDMAKAAEGAANQALGDSYRTRAEGLSAYAELLQRVGSVTPPVRETDAYLAEAQEQERQADEAGQAAQEAYEQAFGLYNSMRPVPQDLVNTLRDIVLLITDGETDLSAQIAAPEEEERAEYVPEPIAGAEAGTPQETIDIILDAMREGRVSGLEEYFYSDDPTIRGMIAPTLGLVASMMRFGEAFEAEYGMTMDEAIESGEIDRSQLVSALSPGLQQMVGPALSGQQTPGDQGMGPGGLGMQQMSFESFDPAQFESMTSADFTVEEYGETAEVFPPDWLSQAGIPEGQGIPMRLIDDRWVIDLSVPEGEPMDPAAAQFLGQLAGILDDAGKAAGRVADQISAGEHADAQSATVALIQEFNPVLERGVQLVMQMMMQGFGGGMGPGEELPGDDGG